MRLKWRPLFFQTSLMNLPDWSLLESLHKHFASVAANMVNNGQEVSPQLFLIGLQQGKPPFAMAAVPAEMTNQFFRDDKGKDALAQFLRQSLMPASNFREALTKELGFGPDVVVQISEAWMASLSEGEDFSSVRKGQQRVSERADRKEVLLVTLHMEHFSIPVMHPIESGPPRHCELTEFPDKHALGQFGGRLAMQEVNDSKGPVH